MNVFDALKSISAYPIPSAVIEDAASQGEIGVTDEASVAVRNSANFKRAKVVIYNFLAEAPNVSQGGISFSFTPTEKAYFRNKANAIDADVENASGRVQYGWHGEDF